MFIFFFFFFSTGDDQQWIICIHFQKQGDNNTECFGAKGKYVQACTQSCPKIKQKRTQKTLSL